VNTAPLSTAARRRKALRADAETLQQLTELGALQCTRSEAALIMDVAEQALISFFARSPAARTAYEAGRGHGLKALRMTQFKLAETNASMAIFLGKNYLDQADRRELERSGAIDVSQEKQRVRDKIAALMADRAAGGVSRSH
jgi:hypothetical protein